MELLKDWLMLVHDLEVENAAFRLKVANNHFPSFSYILVTVSSLLYQLQT